MVVPTLANCCLIVVPHESTVRNARFAVLLVNESFSNKCPEVDQQFAVLNSIQICFKLERDLNVHFSNHLSTMPFPILPFFKSFHKLPTMGQQIALLNKTCFPRTVMELSGNEFYIQAK